MCSRPIDLASKLRRISVLSSMGVVAIPSSLGRRYIEGFFFLPLNISALAVEQSWFWYLSAPSMERLWLPRSREMAALACPLAVRGRDPDLGVAALGAGEGVFTPMEMEDLPEETEETDERGVDCRD